MVLFLLFVPMRNGMIQVGWYLFGDGFYGIRKRSTHGSLPPHMEQHMKSIPMFVFEFPSFLTHDTMHPNWSPKYSYRLLLYRTNDFVC